MTQEELGDAVGLTAGRISQIETDKSGEMPDVLPLLRKALGIDAVPLFEWEREGYNFRLRMANDHLSQYKPDKAKEMRPALAAVTLLPFEPSLNILINLYDARLELSLNNLEAAKEILNTVESRLDNANNETLYQFYYINGLYYIRKAQHEEAFYYYSKALDLKKDKWTYYSTAFCARNLGRWSQSTELLEEAKELPSDHKTATADVAINTLIALNYIGLGLFKRAEKILSEYYEKAIDSDNKMLIGSTCNNYAFLYCTKNDWHTALYYADQAFEHVIKGSKSHLEALYQKGRALIGLSDAIECTKLLIEAKELAKDSDDYSMQFKTLECLLTINNEKSLEYLEDVAIPYFFKLNRSVATLDYCEMVKKQYEKKGTNVQKKLLNITTIMTRTYENLLGKDSLNV